MDTTSAVDVARLTGLSLPTVHRAFDAHQVPPGRRGVPRLAPQSVGAAIVDERGSVPLLPPGRTRESLLVLRVLLTSPFGASSARQVAERAGISPTTAARVLSRARDEGLARERHVRTAEAGRSGEQVRWFAHDVAAWPPELLYALKRVALPRPAATEYTNVPRRFWHQFWNAHPRELTLEADAAYIAARLIDSYGEPETTWTLRTFPHDVVAAAVNRRGADARTRALEAIS